MPAEVNWLNWRTRQCSLQSNIIAQTVSLNALVYALFEIIIRGQLFRRK